MDNFNILAIRSSSAAQVVPQLVANPEDRISLIEAQVSADEKTVLLA